MVTTSPTTLERSTSLPVVAGSGSGAGLAAVSGLAFGAGVAAGAEIAATGSAMASISGSSGMGSTEKGSAIRGCSGSGAGSGWSCGAGSGSGSGSGSASAKTGSGVSAGSGPGSALALAMAASTWGAWATGRAMSLRTEANPAVTSSIRASALMNSSGLKSTMMKPRDPYVPDAFVMVSS